MAEFKVSASCVAKDGSQPSYETAFKVDGRAAIMKKYGLTEAQFDQEAADNISRRITNGVRQTLREKGKDFSKAELDAYVRDWQPGRKAAPSSINAVKKMLKEEQVTPEANAKIEAILARTKAEIEKEIAAGGGSVGAEEDE